MTLRNSFLARLYENIKRRIEKNVEFSAFRLTEKFPGGKMADGMRIPFIRKPGPLCFFKNRQPL